MISERIYPYKAWLLTRSFQPLEIELVGQGYANSSYERTQSGRNHHMDELFPTKVAAIACGEKKLAGLAAELARRQAGLRKRQIELQRHK